MNTDSEDLDVILAEARHLPRPLAVSFLQQARSLAGTLHRIYTRQCNGYGSGGVWDDGAAKRDVEREERSEARLVALFKEVGLSLYLNGDPRGNPVGIHTPKSGKYNTMGGAECGWRL